MLNFIGEKMFLSDVSSVLKKVEKHDEKRTTISAKEILDLSQKRFLLMQDILSPLREELSKYIEIKNMYYDLDDQNNVGIYVIYEENDKEQFFIISQYNLGDDIEVSYESGKDSHSKIVKENKDLIIKAFELGFDHNFEQKFDIASTSNSFIIRNNSILMEIMNKSRINYFDMQYHYSYPNKKIHVVQNIKCVYSNVLASLRDNDVNLNSFMNHVRVYEEKVKYLTKNNLEFDI